MPGEQRVEEDAGEGGLAAVLGPAHDDHRGRGVGGDGRYNAGPVRRDYHLGAGRRGRRPRRCPRRRRAGAGHVPMPSAERRVTPASSGSSLVSIAEPLSSISQSLILGPKL